ncbi:hypothetical protein BH09PAT3_BH09PAT3_5700 [soil metagenome]
MTIHPIIILIRGLPGSGKSHLTQPLAEAIEAVTGHKVTMLDPDATDYESDAYIEHSRKLTEEGVDEKLHAYRFLRGQAYDTIAQHGVAIWNQPFTNLDIFNKMTSRFHEQAERAGTKVEIVVVEVEINPTVAKERVTKRKNSGGHGPSDATFERFVHDYTSFSPHGYNTVTVQGQDEVATSVTTILSKIIPLLNQA